MTSPWAPILVIVVASAFAYFSWRWSVPYNNRTAKVLTGKAPDPGALQLVRWVGVAFSMFFILVAVLKLL